ncbi:MAG: site-2 protease family protein [Erythrobacter sp.]|uniref:site-2 protease family protein n=1 Tax=Erythrobacter sp. TaxID=1042 RepID=UPI003C779F8E
MSDTLALALILIPCLVIAIVFHEVAHGFAAKALGDPTASDRGRLTLNPIRHVDPIGTLLVPGVLLIAGGPVFGWAKPVPVNKWRLSNPRYGMMAVAAAGPATNFLLALIGAVLLGVFGEGERLASSGMLVTVVDGAGAVQPFDSAMIYFLLINIFLGAFNLLPIPPFDGSHILGGLLPGGLQRQWERLQRIGIVLILGVIAYSWIFGTGWLVATIGPLVNGSLSFFLDLVGYDLTF